MSFLMVGHTHEDVDQVPYNVHPANYKFACHFSLHWTNDCFFSIFGLPYAIRINIINISDDWKIAIQLRFHSSMLSVGFQQNSGKITKEKRDDVAGASYLGGRVIHSHPRVPRSTVPV